MLVASPGEFESPGFIDGLIEDLSEKPVAIARVFVFRTTINLPGQEALRLASERCTAVSLYGRDHPYYSTTETQTTIGRMYSNMMTHEAHLPGGAPLYSVVGLTEFPHLELQVQEERPRLFRAATVEDADEESVENEYDGYDGSDTTTEQLCERCKGLGLTVGHFIIDRVAEVTPTSRPLSRQFGSEEQGGSWRPEGLFEDRKIPSEICHHR